QGRGASVETRPFPTLLLWSAGVAHHLSEVVEAAARGAETAKDGVREPQERPVLVDPAEVVHGVAGNVVAEGPRTRRAVPARGAEEGVEVRGNAVVGERRFDAASAGAPVAD